jgi:hypothetical protein
MGTFADAATTLEQTVASLATKQLADEAAITALQADVAKLKAAPPTGGTTTTVNVAGVGTIGTGTQPVVPITDPSQIVRLAPTTPPPVAVKIPNVAGIDFTPSPDGTVLPYDAAIIVDAYGQVVTMPGGVGGRIYFNGLDAGAAGQCCMKIGTRLYAQDGRGVWYYSTVANGWYGLGLGIGTGAPAAPNLTGQVAAVKPTTPIGWAGAPATSGGTTTTAPVPPQPIPLPTTTPAAVPATGPLNQIVATMTAGQTMSVPAGTYKEVVALKVTGTLKGAGPGQSIIDGTGLRPVNLKGVVLVTSTASGATIDGFTIKGGAISTADGQNGAAVRQDVTNTDFTLRNCEICNNQDGVLTFPGAITIDACDFHDNGAPDSQEHNLYVGSGATLTVTASKFHAAWYGNEFKTRAKVTNIDGCTFDSGPIPNVAGAGGNGRCIDCSDGGALTVTNSTFIKRAGSPNHVFVGYAPESSSQGGQALLKSCTFDSSGLASGGIIQNHSTTLAMTIDSPTYVGKDPSIVGNVTVTGTITRR